MDHYINQLTAWKLLLDSVEMIVYEIDTLSESDKESISWTNVFIDE